LATGRFPVLAADQGAAFYGSYNAITTTWGPRFAEWIYPGMLPGEEPRTQLAKRMSEIEADEYWGHKAKQFVRSHWRVIPAMVAAYVVRALLLPQRSAAPNLGSIYTYPEWIFRLGIYAASVVLFIRKPLPLTSWHGLLVAAAALTTGTTTILFYGQQRFLYPLTVLLVSFVCCRLLGREEHA
jgi:hypothetical protein